MEVDLNEKVAAVEDRLFFFCQSFGSGPLTVKWQQLQQRRWQEGTGDKHMKKIFQTLAGLLCLVLASDVMRGKNMQRHKSVVVDELQYKSPPFRFYASFKIKNWQEGFNPFMIVEN